MSFEAEWIGDDISLIINQTGDAKGGAANRNSAPNLEALEERGSPPPSDAYPPAFRYEAKMVRDGRCGGSFCLR